MKHVRPLALLLLLLAACGGEHTDPGPEVGKGLRIVSGNAQVGAVMGELPQPIVVRVVDDAGRPLVGRAVSFDLAASGGELIAGTDVSDEHGEVSGRWTLGPATGRQSLEARATDPATGEKFVATFTATALAAAPASIAITAGNDQIGSAGVPLDDLLEVVVRDAHGNGVSGVAVKWTASEVGGAVAESDTTDSKGTARARWTLGKQGPSEANAAAGPLSALFTARRGIRLASIVTGVLHTCGLDAQGAAYCWGTNSHAELGVLGFSGTRIPTRLLGNLVFRSISAGATHTCALTANGSAYCWGDAYHGQVGVPGVFYAEVPTPVSGGLFFSAIAAGHSITCAIQSQSGALYCWGWFSWTSETSTPELIDDREVFASLHTSGTHSCALTVDGSAYCWGANSSGQLGTGDVLLRTLPTPVIGGLRFVSIRTGWGSTCAITSSGEGYCWGGGAWGELGSGSPATSMVLEPTPVNTASRFTRLWSGELSSCALAEGGAVRCWGQGSHFELGNARTANEYSPVPVSGSLVFAELAGGVGYRHVCALTPAGLAYCWGDNREGQLGATDPLHPNAISVPTLVPVP
jgi:alpha-tubulin suppressor-like RCC1 family protein